MDSEQTGSGEVTTPPAAAPVPPIAGDEYVEDPFADATLPGMPAPAMPDEQQDAERSDAPAADGPPAIPEPAELTEHGPARVIAMVNQKGGVGKTTSTVSLGAALAGYGRRVLLVDFDPQGAVAVSLGVNPNELDVTIYNLLTDPECHVGDVILSTDIVGLDLLPSNIDLSAAEVQLVSEVGREHSLARALRPVIPEYDIILIDCQPSLGLLTVNALTASEGVIIPMETEYFALRGVALLKDTIDKVASRLNPDLRIIGVLPTMFDPRTLHSREVLQTVQQAFGDAVFQTTISRTVKFPDAAVAGEPITAFAPGSAGADSYRQLAREVLAR
ncbi:MAG: AAA family ATPase [Actinomycetales bacterium]|nr:AAA family ATPase [Actinomycetales bacterium]